MTTQQSTLRVSLLDDVTARAKHITRALDGLRSQQMTAFAPMRGMIGQAVAAVVVGEVEHGEQRQRLLVEEDRIIADAGVAEKLGQLGPDGVVAAAIFLHMAGLELHSESVTGHDTRAFWSIRLCQSGVSATAMRSTSSVITGGRASGVAVLISSPRMRMSRAGRIHKPQAGSVPNIEGSG